jgi:hypothetical protein
MLNGYRAAVNTTRLASGNVTGKMPILDENDPLGFSGPFRELGFGVVKSKQALGSSPCLQIQPMSGH